MTSRAAGWPSDAPTASQLKELFLQIENGKVTKESLQGFLRPTPVLMDNRPIEELDLGLRGEEPPAHQSPQLSRSSEIEELELNVRAYNVVKRVGIVTIGDLIDKTEAELSKIPNVGRSAEEIKEKLAAHGFALRVEEPLSLTFPETKTKMGVTSAIGNLFELCKLLDKKADLTFKAAVKFSMIPAEGSDDHVQAVIAWERVEDALNDISGEIDSTVAKLAGFGLPY